METLAINPAEIDFPKLVAQGTEFHGHLGPFLVCGLKMGILALRLLDSCGHFDLRAVVETGVVPPISCLIDGIQVATGCTLGKGNIQVTAHGRPMATFFKDDRQISIELRPELVGKFSEGDAVALAKEAMSLADDELFLWKIR